MLLKRKNGIELPKKGARVLTLLIIAGMALSFTSCKSIVETLNETASGINSTISNISDAASQKDSEFFGDETSQSDMPSSVETADTKDVSGTEESVFQSNEVSRPVVGIRPEFKEAMDSYEEFYKEYVDFLKRYESSDNALSMITDYMDYLSKYAEMGEELNALNTSELSEEETAYYMEVMARITKLLSELY